MEKLIENKLSKTAKNWNTAAALRLFFYGHQNGGREQMPTICCGRYEKWCREASMTKENSIEAIENKKSVFQKACENEKGYKL